MGVMSMYFMMAEQLRHWRDADKQSLVNKSQSYKVIIMLIPTAIVRIFMMIKMSNIRNEERRIVKFSSAVWLTLVGFYVGIWALYGLLSVDSPPLRSFLSLDTVVFLMQLAFYYYNAYQEKQMVAAM